MVRGLSVRDRHPSSPRWARDGGNGSVVSVEAMNSDLYSVAWRLLDATLTELAGYSMDLEQVQLIMHAYVEILESRD